MIVEWLMSLGGNVFDAILMLLDFIPSFPSTVTGAIDYVFNLMFDSISLVGIFVDLNMLKILIPIAIAVLNFDKIFKLVMFVLKKIPIINIK